MKEINVKVKLESNEWFKLNLILVYTNPVMIFLTISGLGMVYIVLNYLTSNSLNLDSFPYFQAIVGLLAMVVLPASTVIQANKNIKSNKWLNQKLSYSFNLTDINVLGETFDLKMLWSDIKTIKEMKDWYIIFTEQQRGFFIPKNRFISKVDELEFKNILIGLKDVNIKLK